LRANYVKEVIADGNLRSVTAELLS